MEGIIQVSSFRRNWPQNPVMKDSEAVLDKQSIQVYESVLLNALKEIHTEHCNYLCSLHVLMFQF